MFRNTRRKKIQKDQNQLKNARGRVYYGMHFYPGICQYSPQGKRPFRVFLNEDTIRKMDATFAGRPVYVHHPDDPISTSLDVIRGEADGWVVRSFYNEKDGKHWTQFIIVTDAGELAIRKGWKLSNCYEALRFGSSGSWNGMNYDKEITEGEYEHLAIVPDPRYEESIILTPDEFKRYNEDKDMELKRLANSKSRKGQKMGFKVFTRKLLKESGLLKNAYVMLPSSKREVSLEQIVAEADKAEKNKGKVLVNSKTPVKFEGEVITLGDLMEAHSEALDEIETLKGQLKNAKKKNGGYKANEDDEDDELENESDEDDELENESDEDEEDEDDGDDADEKKQKNKKTKNSRRLDESDSDDDFEDGIFENDSDEDDSDDSDDETDERKSRRRVNSRDDETDDQDDEDEVDELTERRQRNQKDSREKGRRQQKKLKNSKKKKQDKKKADKLRNAHTKAFETERYGDGLDPLARGQALFGSGK